MNAGSIEATLKLDASAFDQGLGKSLEAVDKFKTSFTKSVTPMAEDLNKLQSSLKLVQGSLSGATEIISKFNVSAKGLSQFSTYASSVNRLANALKILSSDSINAEKSMTLINNMFKYFKDTLNGTEIKVRGVSTAIKELATSENQTDSSSNKFKATLSSMKADLQALQIGVHRYGVQLSESSDRVNMMSDAEARVKIQTKQMRMEFIEAQKDLMRFANSGVEAFNQIPVGAERVQSQMKMMESEFKSAQQSLLNFANGGVEAFNRIGQSVSSVVAKTNMLKLPNTFNNPLDTQKSLAQSTALIQQNSQAMRENGAEIVRNMGYRGKLSVEEEKQTMTIEKNTLSAQKNVGAMNRQTSATRKLYMALSSIRTIGFLVGSTIAYNFVHNLAMATTETINAKSEMNGYFQMLHYTQGEIADFNKELDRMTQLFPRLNKYALGETISSIGVEFELSTEEMKKAMPVVSMITSEYLRAGRNVNEASLAVKDILQGEFQRLSRETGVKSEQLIEAGWSGDKNDVMGLLEALDKVGKSRNWDTFVTKANSLNDAVLILQNRFSEWSADMVEVVQPAIVSVFNNLMSIAEGFATGLSNIWNWFNGGSIEASITQIGLFGGALLTVSQALVLYRGQMGLVQASQLGLKNSIATLVLGMKGEELANVGVRNSIMAKILGVKAEIVANQGVTNSINQKLASLRNEELQQRLVAVQEELSAFATEKNTIATELNTLQNDLNIASEEGLITAKTKERLEEELNTIAKELNTVATVEQEGANMGLIASLYALGTGEALATAETGALATAMGVLNGVFALSPIGWITGLVLALAGAFYVLTGGLDDAWGKMKKFKEAMKDTDSVMQPHTEYLRELEKEVGATDEKYKSASKSVQDFYKHLQSSKAQYDKSELDFENINIKMRAGSDKLFEEGGIPKEKAEEYNARYDYLLLGKDKYYKADQVLNKQIDGENSNYGKNMKEYIQKFGKDSKKFGEYSEKLTGNYQNLAEHSYIANTSDDWWEKSWNQLYAGMDQFWINWDNFWADPNWGDFGKAIHRINVMGQIFEKLGLKPEMVQKAFGDLVKWFSDGFANLGKWFNDGIANWQKGAIDFLKPLDALGDEFNKFMSDPLGYLGVQSHLDNVWKELVDPLIKGITEDFPNYISESLGRWGEIFDGIKQPLMDAWNNFISFEWLNFDSDNTGMKRIDIGALLKGLLSVGDSIDFSWALEWVNTNLISPISQALLMFIVDPVSFIGNVGFSITGLLDSMFGTDIFTSIWTWTNDSIITPIGNAIMNGIMQIPLVGDILLLLGLLSDENIGASEKGRAIANWIGNGITYAIGQIPIISDIAKMLGLIPQTEPDAHSKGQGVGSNIKQGLESGIQGIADSVRNEMNNVITAISNKFGEAYATAHDIGSRILNGIKDALDMHSPSIISRELIANEFGVYIPQAISDAGSVAYNTAMEYGQNIKDGISATSFNTVGFDSAVGEYQADAQMVADSSYLMGTTTTTAFKDMTLAVNQTTNTMTGNVATSYSDMQLKQQSSLNSMKTQNLQAYQDMYLKSNQSLIQMRDSTSNVTAQMVSAWSHMKNQLVATANQLRSESTSHFNQLSDTIGGFYRRIQNPSSWGAGAGTSGAMVRGARHPSAGKSFARVMTRGATHHGAGSPSPYSRGGINKTMTLRSLKNMMCPTGNCDIFDGYDLSQKVDVGEFLSSIEGEHGFGWGDWSGRHYSHIKDTSDQWSMKSPTINLVGGIPTDANYKVGDFENGTPKISFGAFQSMAESIFTAIPYRFYNDSDWKGSWLGALQAGACNCSDGAEALIAFAQVCGFDGYKQHGTWTNSAGQKFGHFWAVINGKKMDTTGWQHGYGWSPSNSGAGGIPVRRATHSPMNVDSSAPSIIININEPVYGVDDLDNKIQESIKQGLREEFNDPWTVAI